ncbi:MAG: Spi family protease inhibitor, partial [Muribaculaceae bacterium]|nr:Spi family protease inhibitor [Muribaculaceae bacterium]
MKKPLIALISLLAAASGSAAELTPSQALSRLQTNSAARKIINRQTMGTPQLIATLPELYVFSTGPGYMVLPADDIALPILAYVDFGKF